MKAYKPRVGARKPKSAKTAKPASKSKGGVPKAPSVAELLQKLM